MFKIQKFQLGWAFDPLYTLCMAINFYSELKSFSDFSGVSNPDHYTDAPINWSVLITDVRNSTRAIESGQYQNVNIAGAATIAATLNALGKTGIPFVFGGDGASALIPADQVDSVKRELLKTQQLIKKSFGLEMRIGIVPIKDILARGQVIRVAKYELAPGNYLAMFQGGGLQVAEQLVKTDKDGNYLLESFQTGDSPNLSGLSCRWTPLASKRGKILSLLVLARTKTESNMIYRNILEQISKICAAKIRDLSPMRDQKPRLRLSFVKIRNEARLDQSQRPYLLKWLRAAILHLSLKGLFLTGIKLGAFDPKKYLEEMTNNLDSRKFDDMLRLVLDCTNDQSEKIKRYLDELYIKKEIFWGSHETNRALMTCLVFSPGQNQHIHFIDGADGGYALAAKQLKKQMTER